MFAWPSTHRFVESNHGAALLMGAGHQHTPQMVCVLRWRCCMSLVRILLGVMPYPSFSHRKPFLRANTY